MGHASPKRKTGELVRRAQAQHAEPALIPNETHNPRVLRAGEFAKRTDFRTTYDLVLVRGPRRKYWAEVIVEILDVPTAVGHVAIGPNQIQARFVCAVLSVK